MYKIKYHRPILITCASAKCNTLQQMPCAHVVGPHIHRTTKLIYLLVFVPYINPHKILYVFNVRQNYKPPIHFYITTHVIKFRQKHIFLSLYFEGVFILVIVFLKVLFWFLNFSTCFILVLTVILMTG